MLKLDVPYIHQVKDIGGADGNWACGPTSAVMVLAYYGMLEPWEIYSARQAASGQPQSPATNPAPAQPAAAGSVASGFAPYVTNVYANRGQTYDATALDPRGNRVAGLYGTICPTGLADWGRMIKVLESHGLSSKRIGASFESVVAALKRGHPVLIGNRLTSVGHVLVAIGYTNNKYLIVNDPYGNRFAPGYGATSGKGAYYPWSCMRATSALEVIGIYPPLTHTPTATATATATAVQAPTETPGAALPSRLDSGSAHAATSASTASTPGAGGKGPVFFAESFGPLMARGNESSRGSERPPAAPSGRTITSADASRTSLLHWLLPALAVALVAFLWLNRFLVGRDGPPILRGFDLRSLNPATKRESGS